MHEYGIVVNIVDTAKKICEEKKITKIEKINVVIGKLNWIYPDIINDCYKMITKGTMLENCQLVVEPVEAVIECKECKQRTTLTEPFFLCSNCLSNNVITITGNELYIDSLEYEN
jgi:hydrogenase nickel incorporation protein HypA/HybF